MRSKLFVPASRPELFAKAAASDADALSFDLEDAVDQARKGEARGLMAEHLDVKPSHGKCVVVRVNAIDTPHFAADLDAVVRRGLDIVNLPKVEHPGEVERAAQMIEAVAARRGLDVVPGILVNIESALGLHNAAAIATARKGLAGLQIGFGDLFAPLGIEQRNPTAVAQTRWIVRMAAAQACIAAYDGAFVDIADPEGYLDDARAAKSLGFSGKSCIHPSQIALANQAFMPTQKEFRAAMAVVKAADEASAAGVGAFVVDGKLVDGPFITRARSVAEVGLRIGMKERS